MYKRVNKKPKKFDFDVIIIGSGAGGGVAAHLLRKKGKKVALVEKEKYGGECPNYGCIPTKSLLQSVETIQVIESAKEFGVSVKDYSYSLRDIGARKSVAVANTGVTEGQKVYESEGIKTLSGSAHFINPWSVSVNNSTYTAKKFLIASGTTSAVPPIPGLVETGYITYREAIDLTVIPKTMLIVGGGAIGCEFAEIFSTLGTKVHIAEVGSRLIGKEDKEVGDLIGAIFENKGVSVYANSKVVSVNKRDDKKAVKISVNDHSYNIEVDEILVTAGKIPNTDLGLENAGVQYTSRGIDANHYMQTSAKHIFTAGDVTGKFMYTHPAAYQSRIAAFNMYEKKKIRAKYHAIPRCVFTLPEVAAVGMTESQVKDLKISYQIGAVPISVIGRSNTSNQRDGFVKVIASHTGVLLGATIVSPRAGEMIHELAIAVNHSMKAEIIADTIHAFPTWSEAVRIACQKIHCQ